MTNKHIKFSGHGDGRFADRGFRGWMVTWLLRRGMREPGETPAGAETRWVKRGQIGKREAYVVFIERATEIEVVTVAWVKSKGAQARRKK